MATSSPPQGPSKYSIPPPWYNLQISTGGNKYIALPCSRTKTEYNTNLPIYLTAFHPTDAKVLQSVLDLPIINYNLISIPNPYTLSDATFWINLQLSGTSALPLQVLRAGDPDPERGVFIGAVSLLPDSGEKSRGNEIRQLGENEHELGYYLHPEWQGRGIMRDAVLALLAWAVREKGVRAVRVFVEEKNLGSRRLIESLQGFEQVGEEREVDWPLSKGGGVKTLLSWRREFTQEARHGSSSNSLRD